MCRTAFAVKNTFICEAPSPAPRRRFCSEGGALADPAPPTFEPAPLEAPCAPCAAAPGCGAAAAPAGVDAVEVLRALEAGGARAAGTLAVVCGAVRPLSSDAVGCHAVQLALERGSPAQVEAMLAGLRGTVAAAACDPHASQVLETAIRVSGRDAAACVAEELLASNDAALNACSSSVVCRLLEHAAGEPRVVELTDRLLEGGAAALCCHKSGHEVAMAIVSNGIARQRAVVFAALRGSLLRFAKHRFAALVLAHALLQSAPAECAALAHELMGHAGAATTLGCHAFGVGVVRALLQVPEASEQVLHYLRKGQHKLRKDMFGAPLLVELGLDKPSGDRGLEVIRMGVVGGA